MHGLVVYACGELNSVIKHYPVVSDSLKRYAEAAVKSRVLSGKNTGRVLYVYNRRQTVKVESSRSIVDDKI